MSANSAPVRGPARNTFPRSYATLTALHDGPPPDAFTARLYNARTPPSSGKRDRERRLMHAISVVTATLEPPHHYIDDLRNYIRDKLDHSSLRIVRWWSNFILGFPFVLLRAIWHYVILEMHLFYNLGLLYYTVIATPELIYYVIGMSLFWIRIVYEVYRDILHRDDPIYTSTMAGELSIAAAISAGMGFIVKIKMDQGIITESWWVKPVS